MRLTNQSAIQLDQSWSKGDEQNHRKNEYSAEHNQGGDHCLHLRMLTALGAKGVGATPQVSNYSKRFGPDQLTQVPDLTNASSF